MSEKKFKQNEEIFNFIYGCALHDAVLQLSYEGEKAWIEKEVPEARIKAKEYIDRLINKGFTSQDKHDDFFSKKAKLICDEINEKGKDKNPDHENEFTFGNAQKLLNILAKHIYGQCYSNSKLRDCFEYCHCPMDSIMLEKVWKAYEKLYKSKNERANELNKGLDVRNDGNFLKSWGKENWEEDFKMPKRYQNFQEAIRRLASDEQDCNGNKLFPIEYDYFVWGN